MITLNDFTKEPEELRRRQMEAVESVFRSGHYVLGREVRAFESEWAASCGARHAVGVASGLDAIEVGLRALGIGKGDEVITTTMTAFASVLAIIRAGATPVLADIDESTGLTCMESVIRCRSPKTRALVLVHLYGHLSEPVRWAEFCRDQDIVLVEDCAQAHGASWDGRLAGTFGRFGAYSFYPTKNLGAIGDAGALITDDDRLAEDARVLRNYGQSDRYHHVELGLNSRLDELQAAILRVRLQWLDRFTVRRRQIADTYRRNISNPCIRLLKEPADPANHVNHLFVILSDRRNELAGHLSALGVGSLSHYPVPAHQQPALGNPRSDPYGLRRAEQHGVRCLSIPCHPQMSDEEVARVIEGVNAFA